MQLYPIFLKLEDTPVLLVGGGQVAERKARGLLAAGAVLTVRSPQLCEGLRVLHGEERISWRRGLYRDGDLEGFTLAVAATNDARTNRRVHAEGARRGVLVNSVDDPDNCDFFVPAVARRGALTLAVSTAGVSPYLARRLREALEARLYPGVEEDLEHLGRLRRSALGAGGAVQVEPLEALVARILQRLGLT